MNLRYINAAMTAAEASDIRIDLGRLLQHRNGRGEVIPGTARVDVTPNGAGFDITIPAEHAAQITACLNRRNQDEIAAKSSRLESEAGR